MEMQNSSLAPASAKRLKIFVFIDSDVTIRHFLLSDAFEVLVAEHDCVFILPPLEWNRIVDGRSRLPKAYRVETLCAPESRRRIWRRLVSIDQMRFPTRTYQLRYWKLKFKQWGAKVALFHSFLALPGVRSIAETFLHWQLSKAPFDELDTLLERERPNILLHPSTFEGYFVNDFVFAGKKRGIPTVLLMNSWDNPSTKRAVSGLADHVLVWGEQTRRHCVEMMRMPPDRVHVFGAAQFDVFRSAPTSDGAAYRREYGFDENVRLLLYAGSTKPTDEAGHLRQLDDAISAGHLGDVKVLYRPHPYGMAADKAKSLVAATYKHVRIERSMYDFLVGMAEKRRAGFYITDYRDTHDLLSVIDALVSPISTMLIEAALHGKPSLCYSPPEENLDGTAWAAGLRHMEELFEHDMVLLCNDRSRFIDDMKKLIAMIGDPAHRKAIEEKVLFFVAPTKLRYKDELARFVVKLCAR